MRSTFILVALLALPAAAQGVKPTPKHITLQTHPRGRTTPPPAPKHNPTPQKHRDTTPKVRGAAPMKR